MTGFGGVTNLVFEGGGVKGVAYCGALHELDSQGILPAVTSVAGTSAGAITAALVAAATRPKSSRTPCWTSTSARSRTASWRGRRQPRRVRQGAVGDDHGRPGRLLHAQSRRRAPERRHCDLGLRATDFGLTEAQKLALIDNGTKATPRSSPVASGRRPGEGSPALVCSSPWPEAVSVAASFSAQARPPEAGVEGGETRRRASMALRMYSTSSDEGWRAEARCRDADPGLFFSIGKGAEATRQTLAAKALCAACRVQHRCLNYALATEQEGVWGGTTEGDRRALRRGRRISEGAEPRVRAISPL